MKHDLIITTNRDLVLDCDGVLLDWISGFIKYAEIVLGRKLDPAGHTDFDLSGWLECDTKELTSMIDAFNGGDGGYFGRLDPIPGAREALAAAHAQGRPLSVITACSTDPKVIADRVKGLQSTFGDIFKDIHAVGLHESKSDLLSEYKGGTWVEDKAENALLGAELGLSSYLIRTSHNARFDGVMTHANLNWVDGWDCIRKQEGL